MSNSCGIAMRYPSPPCYLLILLCSAGANAHAQTGGDGVQQAAHLATSGEIANPELVRQLARHRGGQPAALAQIIQLSRGFNDALAAEMLDELATAHYAAGN